MSTRNVAAVVRAECARRGYKQADLMAPTGLTRTVVHGRWHGRTPWTAVELAGICALLGDLTSLDVLVMAGVVRPAAQVSA